MLEILLKKLCEANAQDYEKTVEYLKLAPEDLAKSPSMHQCVLIGQMFGRTATDIKDMVFQLELERKPEAHEYTVCLLFNENLTHVLLQRKMKTEFQGLLNGVGGSMDAHETPERAALREIREETGVKASDIINFGHIGTLTLPHDCKTKTDDDCTLHYFTGVVKQDVPAPQPGEPELLEWHNVNYVRNMSIPSAEGFFAGNGDLQFFVHMAVRYHKANDSMNKAHTLKKSEAVTDAT